MKAGRGEALIPRDGVANVGDGLKDWVEAPDTEAYRSLDPRELILALGEADRQAIDNAELRFDRFVHRCRHGRLSLCGQPMPGVLDGLLTVCSLNRTPLSVQ